MPNILYISVVVVSKILVWYLKNNTQPYCQDVVRYLENVLIGANPQGHRLVSSLLPDTGAQ